MENDYFIVGMHGYIKVNGANMGSIKGALLILNKNSEYKISAEEFIDTWYEVTGKTKWEDIPTNVNATFTKNGCVVDIMRKHKL